MKQPYEPNLFKMIQEGGWRSLSRVLKLPKAKRWMQKQRDGTNMTCLSLALGVHAPLEIIEEMMVVDPKLAYEKDCFGETALHIACLNGASIDAVSLLIEHDQHLPCVVDLDRRVPLHHAVEYACEREVHENGSHSTYLDVIQLLCEAAPETLYFCDRTGDTPIDLVQSIKTNFDESSAMYEKLHCIYSELTSHSVKYYSEQKKKWEMEGHKISTEGMTTDKSQPSLESTWQSNVSSIHTPNSNYTAPSIHSGIL